MICQNLKMLRNGIPRVFINILPRNGIPSCFLFRAMVGMDFLEFASIFLSRNGIPTIFFFHGKVLNGIPRVCLYYCSIVQNSEHFFLQWIGWNGIPRVFCYAEQPEFRRKKPIASSIPWNIFCGKLPTRQPYAGVDFILQSEIYEFGYR